MYEDKLKDFSEASVLLSYFVNKGITEESIKTSNLYLYTGKVYTVTGRRGNAVQFGKFIVSCNDDEDKFYVSVLEDDEFGTINDPKFNKNYKPKMRVMCDLW